MEDFLSRVISRFADVFKGENWTDVYVPFPVPAPAIFPQVAVLLLLALGATYLLIRFSIGKQTFDQSLKLAIGKEGDRTAHIRAALRKTKEFDWNQRVLLSIELNGLTRSRVVKVEQINTGGEDIVTVPFAVFEAMKFPPETLDNLEAGLASGTVKSRLDLAPDRSLWGLTFGNPQRDVAQGWLFGTIFLAIQLFISPWWDDFARYVATAARSLFV